MIKQKDLYKNFTKKISKLTQNNKLHFCDKYFLLIPIVYVIFLYFRNFKYKTKILYAEAYLGLNVLCYCVYYLIAYRIHHSYSDLTKNDFLMEFTFFIFYS